MGNAPADDHVAAKKLLTRLKAESSIYGQGTDKNSDFSLRVASILDEDRPSARVIAIAGWIAPKEVGLQWEREIVGALEDAFRLQLNDDLIRNQDALAASNDRLGNKMLFVAWVGVAVALIGAGAAVLQIFGV